ncbi:MAG: threonine synthase [Saprospiraceae bacterium]
MKLYSTNNKSKLVSLKEAVLKGLPEDNGLYMPRALPKLPASFIANLKNYTFQEIGFEVCKSLVGGAIPDNELWSIIERALTFPAPLVSLEERISVLELFHGPSLAFKDFGARFMAQLMSFFNKGENDELVILVATSGDTGGAVAAGFHQTPGIKVVILYPSGKVSHLQEKQLTTLGGNVTALEIDGSFDDCQALVKQAFLDEGLINKIRLSSANSINIARLIPQTFYYFEAYKQLASRRRPPVFCVPSGNFGNLTAGLMSQRMGLPIHHFIAATNVNDVVPAYLKTGRFIPKPSLRTLSNAMDVGNPSNFVRMLDLYRSTWNNMSRDVSGFSFNDEQTKAAIREVFEEYNYVIDPHGAVGYLAASAYLKEDHDAQIIVLETAHPSKFLDDVQNILSIPVDVPERLARLVHLEKRGIEMSTSFSSFKDWLLANY